MSKTGGGVGTNQYKIRGHASKRHSGKTNAEKHEDYRVRLAKHCPVDQLADWATDDVSPRVRLVAAKRMSLDELDWAFDDLDQEVRDVAWERFNKANKQTNRK